MSRAVQTGEPLPEIVVRNPAQGADTLHRLDEDAEELRLASSAYSHKLAAMALFASLFLRWRRVGRQVALGVPVGLAILDAGVTAWNAAVIGALVA